MKTGNKKIHLLCLSFRIGHFHQDYRKNLGKMTRQDNIPYNSCFYTAMEQNYDYVAILDIDEASIHWS